MDTQEAAFRNGYLNLVDRIRDYASQDFADQIAQPGGPTAFDRRMSLTELSLCFADMDYVLTEKGAKELALSKICVQRLVEFQAAIEAVVDDGSVHSPDTNDEHMALFLRGLPLPPVPRGPRWKSDAEIVSTPEWNSIQEDARQLLLLLPPPNKFGGMD